ncbi:MAG TPA: flagellar hook-length control protein FliK, partial [Gammaproteobacteria bacterium]|nr:flagellar hook-length control protein FliK [Gammaproteobacteria bacterium]
SPDAAAAVCVLPPPAASSESLPAAAAGATALSCGTELPPGGSELPLAAKTEPAAAGARETGTGEQALDAALRPGGGLSLHALALEAGPSGREGRDTKADLALAPDAARAPGAAAPAAASPSTPAPAAAPTAAASLPTLGGSVPSGVALEHALAQRLVWMVRHGAHDARLHLHPEHLGALEVRLMLDGDAAHVTLSSPHAVVRDALTQALPQLRDLLGGAGLDLAHVDVDAGLARHAGTFHGREGGARESGSSNGLGPAEPAAGAIALKLPAGLVDLFA